jgi:hypothetical protein
MDTIRSGRNTFRVTLKIHRNGWESMAMGKERMVGVKVGVAVKVRVYESSRDDERGQGGWNGAGRRSATTGRYTSRVKHYRIQRELKFSWSISSWLDRARKCGSWVSATLFYGAIAQENTLTAPSCGAVEPDY